MSVHCVTSECVKEHGEEKEAKPASDADYQREFGPIKLDRLLCEGFTHREIQTLKEGGFSTIESIAFAPAKSLLALKGFSENKVATLKTKSNAACVMGFVSAHSYLQVRENIIKFTTGCNQLDQLLRGGVESGSLTEVFGEFRTGKTQLCHTLAVTCQLPIEQNGGEGRCLWIDTEGTFRPERIVAIAQRFGLNPSTCLENICYAKAYNTDHQLDLLAEAGAIMAESRYGILIIDSATNLYRSEYTGRGELAPRQVHLCRFLRGLQRLADTYGVAVILTNQVMAKVDAIPGFGGPDKVPVGGHIMAHASQTRLYLRKGRGEQRICRIYDSPSLPEAEAAFCISEGGIVDPAE